MWQICKNKKWQRASIGLGHNDRIVSTSIILGAHKIGQGWLLDFILWTLFHLQLKLCQEMYSGDYVCMKPLRNKKISLNLGVFMFLFKQVYLPLKTSKLNLGVVFFFFSGWIKHYLIIRMEIKMWLYVPKNHFPISSLLFSLHMQWVCFTLSMVTKSQLCLYSSTRIAQPITNRDRYFESPNQQPH